MSAIEEALYTIATQGPTVGPLIGTRCYPVTLPQAPSYPAMTYQQISEPRAHAMGSDPGLVHPRFQLTAFAKTRTAAQDLAAAIITDFSRQRGTIAGVTIQDILVEDRHDLPWDPEVEVHMVPVDVIVHALET